jgi:hypothetical protein
LTTKTQARKKHTAPPSSTVTYDAQSDLEHYPHSELVFAVVSPVGIDNRRLKAALEKALDFYSYKINPIRLTDFLKTLPDGYLTKKIDTSSEYARINTSMDAGNEVRRKMQSGSALARYAALVIHQSRHEEAGQRASSRSVPRRTTTSATTNVGSTRMRR